MINRKAFLWPEKGRHCNTTYEGLNLANQFSRKLGVFDQKEIAPYSIVILTYIRNKEAILLKFNIFHSIKLNRCQEDIPLY